MRAEYDHENNRVVALETDDGRITGTNSPRVLGAPTEWIGVDIVYPDGYDARFNSLLRAVSVEYAYDAQNNRITVQYPDADFSPEAIRARLFAMVKNAAGSALGETDWYVVREMETETPMPSEVKARRAELRSMTDAYEAEIAQIADEDLNNWTFAFDGEVDAKAAPSVAGPVPGGDGKPWVTDATKPDQEGKQVRQAKDIEVTNEQINPFSPVGTYGSVRSVVPEQPTEGLPWKLGDYPNEKDGR